MDWSNEPYVKIYTRETDDDLELSWEARALWTAAMVKFDRSGSIDTKHGARGLARVTRIPFEIVERALFELLQDGRLVETDRGFTAPNFMDAQAATKSDKLRQQESRERRRSRNLEGAVTNRDASVTNRDQTSRDVTLSLADPKQSVTPARDDTRPEPLRSGTRDPDPARTRRQEIRNRIWSRLSETRAAIAAELGLAVRPLPAFDPGERELGEWLLTEGDRVEADAMHVLEIYAAEARATGTVKWLTGSMFDERPRRRALGMTLADVTSARASAQPAPALRIKRDDDDNSRISPRFAGGKT